MKMEEEGETTHSIPGLPEPDQKGKKGKKKSNSKKTLTLQNFMNLQESNNQVQENGSVAHVDNNQLQRPSLEEKEVAILESCHSYIHDFLKQRGPSYAMDPNLQQEINNFPPEAKQVMEKVGGYRKFILLCKDLVVVDRIVAAKVHLSKAQEMAFKEIYNNIPGGPGESKPIFNPAGNPSSKGGVWPSSSNLQSVGYSDHSNSGVSGGTIQYHQSGQEETMPGKGVIGGGLNKNGIFNPGSVFGGDQNSGASKELQSKIWSLTSHNNHLIKQLTEKEQQVVELNKKTARLNALEQEHESAKAQIRDYRDEIDRLKAEIEEIRAGDKVEEGRSSQQNEKDRDLIFQLQSSLEAEKLKNKNLVRQLEGPMSNMNLHQNSLNSNLPIGSRSSGFGGLGLDGLMGGGGGGGLDQDPFGLRGMGLGMNIQSGGGSAGGLNAAGVGHSMFGAIGSDLSQSRGFMNKSASTSQLGGFPQGLGMGLPSYSALVPGPFSTPLSSTNPLSSSLANPLSSSLANPLSSSLANSIATSASSISGHSGGHLGPSLLPPTSALNSTSGSLGGFGSAHSTMDLGPIGGGGQSGLGGSQGLGGPQGLSQGLGGPQGLSQGLGGPQGLSHGLGGPQGLVGPQGLSQGLGGSSGLSQGPPGLSQGPPGLSQGSQLLGGLTQGLGGMSQPIPNSAPSTPAPAAKSNSAIRQEQLVRKVVSSIPGATEESVKRYIQVLREQHGKLSGWATSRIIQEITELMKQG